MEPAIKKHRILLVIRHPVGGIRTFCRYVYRNFGSEKYRFTLLAPDTPETRVLLDDLRELDLNYVPLGRNTGGRRFFRGVTRAIRTGDFDIVHSHGFTSGACAVLGALTRRRPHILTCHDVFNDRQFVGFSGAVRKWALAALMSTIDCIHCVSHDARENLLAHLPLLRWLRRNVIAIPNGIEVDRFVEAVPRDLKGELGLPGETFLIGFLGRFMSQKGFRYLVDALAGMVARSDLPRRPVVLTFGEDGFVREEKEAVGKRGLSDVVRFMPFVADAAPTLKGLDVLVMPSLWEASPLLAMEAMVAGIPVVGTNCIGLREVLRNTPATVVPPRDSVALAEALISEMRNPTTANARAFATEAAVRFQVDRPAADLEKLMVRLMKK
jgi:glycosyltransferase involved in cell wall biosynthesis